MKDPSGIEYGKYLTRKDEEYATCQLCQSDFKYGGDKGYQALESHAKRQKHMELSHLRFSDNVLHLKLQEAIMM